MVYFMSESNPNENPKPNDPNDQPWEYHDDRFGPPKSLIERWLEDVDPFGPADDPNWWQGDLDAEDEDWDENE